MKKLILLLPALLLLAHCAAATPNVMNVMGQQLGSIRTKNDIDASVVDVYGRDRGSIHGDLVRDVAGKLIGRVVTRQEEVLILGQNGTLLGNLREGTGCYGRDQSLLGHIDVKTKPEFAGAACLLLLMNK